MPQLKQTHYHSLFHNNHSIMLLVDPQNGRIEDANTAAVAFYGYSRDELVGKRVAEINILPEDQILREMDSAKQEKRSYFNMRHRLADGSIRDVEIYSGPIRLSGRSLLYSIIHDVTSRRMVERQLEEKQAILHQSEERYRQLFNTMLNGFALHEIILDPSGKPIDYRFLDVNPAFERLTGLQAGRLVGKTVLEVMPGTEPHWIEIYGQVALSGVPAHYENFSRELDKYYEVYVYSPKPGQFATLVADTSEQRKSEQQMRLLTAGLETAANGVIITDRSGKIEWANPAFFQLSGYSPQEVIGKDPGRLIKSNVQTAEFYQHMWETILAGKAWQGELVNRKRNGTFYNEEMTITPVRAVGDEISHFIAIKHDITPLKEHNRHQEAIAFLSTALRCADTTGDMAPIILDITHKFFDATALGLALRDPANGDVQIRLGKGLAAGWTGQRFHESDGITGLVLRTAKAYIQNDTSADPNRIPGALESYTPCIAAIPLTAKSKTIGVLMVGRERSFSDGDINILTSLAEISANAIRRADQFEQTRKNLERLESLHRIDLSISSTTDLDATLQVVLEQVTTHLAVDSADIWVYHAQPGKLRLASAKGFLYKPGMALDISEENTCVGQVARSRQRLFLREYARCPREHPVAFLNDRQENFASYVGIPLLAKDQLQGILEIRHRSTLDPSPEWFGFLEILAGQAAIAIDNASLFNGLQSLNLDLINAYDTTLEGWAKALELRDHETEGHSRRVTDMTVVLARGLGISEPEIAHIRRGALLHDIGKIGIPDEILFKNGPLNEEEWSVMRRHPQLAFDLLSGITFLQPALEIPYCHHERWDGKGYPRGLSGEQIPLAARIFAVVDVWDALISLRPYRPAWTIAQANTYLAEQSGRHFDPRMVSLFLGQGFGEYRVSDE